jgi:hypothetical protein
MHLSGCFVIVIKQAVYLCFVIMWGLVGAWSRFWWRISHSQYRNLPVEVEYICESGQSSEFKWINQPDAAISQVYYMSHTALHVSGIFITIIRSSTRSVAASGLPLGRGDSSAVGRVRADRPDHDQQHCYHHAPTGNQRLLLNLLSSWWWAWGCPKHVELYLNVKQ